MVTKILAPCAKVFGSNVEELTIAKSGLELPSRNALTSQSAVPVLAIEMLRDLVVLIRTMPNSEVIGFTSMLHSNGGGVCPKPDNVTGTTGSSGSSLEIDNISVMFPYLVGVNFILISEEVPGAKVIGRLAS